MRTMNINRLKWLAIILPVVFWVVLLILRNRWFAETSFAGDVFAVLVLMLGAALFSTWVFSIIARVYESEKEARAEAERASAQAHHRSAQLRALYEANLTLTTEHDLPIVLQKVVELARELSQAQYGALGVLDEQGESIEQFLTVGITPEQRALMGELPRGHGLLGVLIKEGQPIRIPEIAADSRAGGFPPRHPPMHSLLGVPIRSKGKVIGDLYMTDKRAATPNDAAAYTVFSEDDQRMLEMFATQAAIAIENAQLYRQTQQLAILQERERFGMDLHDGVIQSIYAIGLTLEDGQYHIASEPQQAHERIGQAIHGLNDVIRDIRNYILDLRPQRFQGRSLHAGLEELARDLRANSFLTINLQPPGADPIALAPEQTVAVLHIAQEALTNVRKHARASRVDIGARREDGQLILTISDDGVGLKPSRARAAAGHGLHNMRERAHALRGDVSIEPCAGGGTCLTLRVPLS